MTTDTSLRSLFFEKGLERAAEQAEPISACRYGFQKQRLPAERNKPPSSQPWRLKVVLGGRSQARVPPLPCLRPYHARIDPAGLSGCDSPDFSRRCITERTQPLYQRLSTRFLGSPFRCWAFHWGRLGFGIGTGLHHAVRSREKFGLGINGQPWEQRL